MITQSCSNLVGAEPTATVFSIFEPFVRIGKSRYQHRPDRSRIGGGGQWLSPSGSSSMSSWEHSVARQILAARTPATRFDGLFDGNGNDGRQFAIRAMPASRHRESSLLTPSSAWMVFVTNWRAPDHRPAR